MLHFPLRLCGFAGLVIGGEVNGLGGVVGIQQHALTGMGHLVGCTVIILAPPVEMGLRVAGSRSFAPALLQIVQLVDSHILNLPLVGTLNGEGDGIHCGDILHFYHEFAQAVSTHMPVILQVAGCAAVAGAVVVASQRGHGVDGSRLLCTGSVRVAQRDGDGVIRAGRLDVGGLDLHQILILRTPRLRRALLHAAAGKGDIQCATGRQRLPRLTASAP